MSIKFILPEVFLPKRLISQLLLNGYPSEELEIQNCIRFASICGLITCLGEGAIEQQPDYAKVNELFGSKIL